MARAWLKAAVIGMALTGMTVSAQAADTLKIGVPGAHSGDLASYGLPSLNAARIVVDEFNAKGGLLGKQIEIIAQDDQCKPEMGTNAATKILSEGVVAVMGSICSGATKAALPIYNDAKLVSISPSATTPELTKSGAYPYFFRTVASDDVSGHLAAAFLRDKLNAKKVAVLHDKGDYGRGFVTFAKEELVKGNKITIVLEEGITAGAVDYGAVIQKIRKSGADAVIFGGYHPEASKLVQQMRKKRLNIAFIGPDGVKDEQFIKVAGPDAEGVYATGPTDVSKLPMNIKAHENHKTRFGAAPGAFYDNAYSATIALLTAIEKAGSTEPQKIMEALRTNPVDTPIGTIKFDAHGDAEGAGFSIYQVKNGSFVEMK
ncbi:MAG: branched-chain amino acid ABC transporter substrate-binding protein [Bilophila sp.]